MAERVEARHAPIDGLRERGSGDACGLEASCAGRWLSRSKPGGLPERVGVLTNARARTPSPEARSLRALTRPRSGRYSVPSLLLRPVSRLASGLAVALSLAACGAALASRPVDPPARLTLYGYHAWWMGDAWRASAPMLDGLYYFELRIDAEGRVAEVPEATLSWAAFARQARAAGQRASPTITLFDLATFGRLFADAAARAALVETVAQTVEREGGSGVNLDVELFEAVPAAARDGYAAFVEALARRLGAGKRLTVFLPAFDEADAFDEARVARAATAVIVQGYDLHWVTGPTSGAVAPVRGNGGANWAAITARYDALGVPRAKRLMAAPLYGIEWPTTTDRPGSATRGAGRPMTMEPVPAWRLPDIRLDARTASREAAARRGLRRDADTGQPYYVGRDSAGGVVQGWFEDAESVAEKAAFVRREGLAGLVFFPLGYDDAALVRTAAGVGASVRRR